MDLVVIPAPIPSSPRKRGPILTLLLHRCPHSPTHSSSPRKNVTPAKAGAGTPLCEARRESSNSWVLAFARMTGTWIWSSFPHLSRHPRESGDPL